MLGRKKIFFLMFLIGVVTSDWIEITKVGHLSTKQIDTSEIVTSPPSYIVSLDKPTNLHEILLIKQTKTLFNKGNNNESKKINGNSERKKENCINHCKGSSHDSDNEEVYIEDGKINEKIITNDDNVESRNDNILIENNESSSYKNKVSMMSIIKRVQTQILDFNGRSIQSKIEHLEKLRDIIVYEIKNQVFHLLTRRKNQSEFRLFKNNDHSNEYLIEYPSNEGVLMTIGLLTFAVFLIKLVLKFIYIFKLKQQNYYTTMTSTPVNIFLRKTDREDEQDNKLEESVRILRYIEEYSSS